jgi:hypothetical protein
MNTLTLIAPACTCCATPELLVPREDLETGMAACPTTGQFYRYDGKGYAPSETPLVTVNRPAAPAIQIDLDQATYA